jgi:hypothetical protein
MAPSSAHETLGPDAPTFPSDRRAKFSSITTHVSFGGLVVSTLRAFARSASRLPNILVLVALAAALALCPGCISMIAAVGCAAAGGNCDSSVMGDAFRADIAIANGIAEGAQRSAPAPEREGDYHPPEDLPRTNPPPLEEIVPPPPHETLVTVSVVGSDRERVQVSRGRGSGVLAACAPPCTLSLAPADYVFSVGGYTTSALVKIPEVGERTLRLDVSEHDELRIWGWSLFGGGLVGLGALTAAVMALDIDDPSLILPSMALNGLAVMLGMVLGVWPDELAIGASF